MNQEGKKTMLRATVDMDFDLKDEIHDMAKKKNWAFSYMCYVLLQQAVKEKNRKKSVTKEVHS
jgi:hypothetical protein